MRRNDVFLSYASTDRALARALAERLADAGMAVWWDRQIRPGERFEQVIETAIDDSRCVVVLWSEASLASDWVRAEAMEGLDRGSLVPVLIEPTRIPLAFRPLNAVNLVGWPYAHDPVEFERLCERIGAVAPAVAKRATTTGGATDHESQPSIAVLPLVSVGASEIDEALSAGVTSEVISSLSRLPGFFVIAFGSTWGYRGEPRDPRTISTELGVRYVVQGNVQQSGARIRVSVNLVDAPSRKQLWSESFDIAHTLADLIEMQHDIASGIAGRLQPRLLSAERVRQSRKPPEELQAWQLMHRARPAYVTNESSIEALAMLRRAIELDPGYVEAHAQLALHLSFMSIIKDIKYANEAREAIDRALALDPDHELALLSAGVSYVILAQYEQAVACCERAVELNPNLANAWAYLALAILGAHKDGATALAHLDRAFALSPRDEGAYLWYHMKAPCHAQMGDFQAAADSSGQSVRRFSGWWFSWLCHAQYLALLGDVKGTQSAWAEARRRFPALTLKRYRQIVAFSPLSADLNQKIVDALAAMGVE